MGVTSDRNDPRLTHGADETPADQADMYLVLSDEERARGFVRPVRRSYIHAMELGGCGAITTMAAPIAETYAANPHFYGATYCCRCRMHRPVGADGEFLWEGTTEEGRHVSAEYPESAGECYVDIDAQLGPGGDLALLPDLLLDADTAANFIASIVSNFTEEEVDGDGDPWSIACEHLDTLLTNVKAILLRHPAALSELASECGYFGTSTEGRYR